MRVLVLSNLFPPETRGGYEVDCAGIVDHLRERHEVRVISSVQGPPSDELVARVLPFVEGTPANTMRAPLATVAAVRATRAEVERFRPELVFVWNGANIPHAAIRVLDGLGVPLAFRIEEHWFSRLYGYGDAFLRYLQPGQTGVKGAWSLAMRAFNAAHPALRLDLDRVAPAAVCWVSAALHETSPAPPAIRVTHEEVLFASPPHTERYLHNPRIPQSGDPVILYASRFESQKGPDVAVRALASLLRRHDVAARLVMAGSGDPEPTAQLARELGIADRVDIRGLVSAQELGEIASSAAVWIIPSVWEEPAPIVGIEAAVARVPVVASRIGGIPEVTEDGIHGLLFAPGDAEDAAARLADTLRDPDATARRVSVAFERAKGLSHQPYARAIDAFLERAIAAHPR